MNGTGNIRELKNLIHRLFITGTSPTIEDEELDPILSKQSEITSTLDSSLFTLPLKKKLDWSLKKFI